MPILREGGGNPVDIQSPRSQTWTPPDQATINVVDTTAAQTLTNKTLTNPSISGNTPVNETTSTLTITAALHANRVVTLNRAAGIAVTLPAATGTGDKYTFVVGTTFTGDAGIAVPNATDYMIGTALLLQDAGDTVVGFATANTGTVATESDRIDLFDTGNTTGGIKGAVVELIDIATAIWSVRYVSDAAGTEATPFKVAV